MNASVKETGERSAKRPEKIAPLQAVESGKLTELSSFSDDELAALASGAQAELAARRERRRAEFFERIREQARALDIDPEEVVAALSRKGARSGTDRRAAVAPKYRNPQNAAETWSGRGQRPKWLETLLAQGKQLEDFLISA
ncbi:MAG TPA: H-NS histone family protein [Polyangiaceae bacterium]|nr:H-NS histone family protein [Polyangiaceae bacterium]